MTKLDGEEFHIAEHIKCIATADIYVPNTCLIWLKKDASPKEIHVREIVFIGEDITKQPWAAKMV